MNNRPSIEVGQLVKTNGRQITVPGWHEMYTTANEWQKVADMPCIRLSCGFSHGRASDVQIAENWSINTNTWNQSGLVCFVSERYLGMAILSVSIVSVRSSSVIAQPVEWIEVNPTLGVNRIGDDAQEVFDRYLDKVQEKIDGDKDFDEQDTSCLEYRAIWHNKAEEVKA